MGRHAGKLTVEDCVTISTGDLLRHGFLPECDFGSMTWRNGFGDPRYSLTLSVRPAGDRLLFDMWGTGQHVTLESMPLHFGGSRWWFLCPQCSRRCAKLHLFDRYFARRVCCNLAYQSSRLHRSFGDLARVLSRKKGREVSPAEVERVFLQEIQRQRPRFVRKRDRRPDYKPLNVRRQSRLGGDLA